MKKINLLLALFAALTAESITLTAPKEGATVPLLSEKQKAFMAMPREKRAAFFDDAQPKMERAIKHYRSEPQPVRLEWKDAKGPCVVAVTKRGASKPWFEATVASNSIEVWNLEIACTYDWTVRCGGESAKGSFTTEDVAPRLIRVPKVPNIRDIGGRVIGGRRVRQGLVYRSSGLNNNPKTVFYTYDEILKLESEGKLAGMGALGAKYSAKLKSGKGLDRKFLRLVKIPPKEPGTARLTEEWRKYMTDKLGIKTDIDLRSTGERLGMTGSPLGPGVNFVTMPTNYHGYSSVHTSGADDTRRVLRVFLDRSNYPIDFHCIGGADRTGTFATILHGILGLDDDEIWKDYQVTAWQGGVNDTRHLGWFTAFVKSFDKFEGATLSERIRKYVLWLGFTEADMQTIRDILMEPADASAAAAAPAGDGMIWGMMMQLGHNMWGEQPLVGEPKTEEERDKYARDFNRTDQKLWDEVTEYAAKKGVNMLLIDLGEGMIYPSHPELAVNGSWSPDKMKKELARLRKLGLEPIPKLNFSASHDAWLKEYSRMLSTPEYYKVCADVIRDVCEIFDKPRLFHLGWDEEKMIAQRSSRLALVRQHDLWWRDFMFTVKEVEKNGSQAWLWSDVNWKHHKEFLEKMPHRVMQSNWHYFLMQRMVRNEKEIQAHDWPEAWAGPLGFLELEEAKYDQIPCASNYRVPKNLGIIVKFTKEHIARERVKGFLMAPWARSYGDKARAKLLEACDLIEQARQTWASDEKDVIIYGATSAGIAAAVQARKMGLEPIVIEPTDQIGGLTTGGLGQTDIGNKAAFGGIARQFYKDIKAYYENDAAWKFQTRDEYKPRGQSCWERGEDSMWTFEPSAAREVLEFWVRDNAIVIHRNERLDRGPGGVEKKDGRIVAIRTESGRRFAAKMFIDCTYEGDLMAAAGVSYTVGREPNSKYGETISGIQRALMKNHQLNKGVDPYVKKGDPSSGLLPGIEQDVADPDGSGDGRVQAYCYRMCLTDDPRNRIPFKKPEGYRELDYELLLRNLEAGELDPAHNAMPWINSPMPNRKTDTNNRTGFSTDLIGGSDRWPEASYAEREAIAKTHLKYQQGLMWTLANNPRVPDRIRNEFARWGTCKDEFVGQRGDGWQNQLYVREARRMVGEYVMTEHECRGERVAPRSIGLGAYGMDSHNCRRYVTKDGFALNEGNVEDYNSYPPNSGKPFKRFKPYPIDYGAIVPKRGECTNLLVPVCLSASHMAFGSIRMEPVFFALGQSAATAAAFAIDDACAVQDVDYAKLRKRLLANGQKLELP